MSGVARRHTGTVVLATERTYQTPIFSITIAFPAPRSVTRQQPILQRAGCKIRRTDRTDRQCEVALCSIAEAMRLVVFAR